MYMRAECTYAYGRHVPIVYNENVLLHISTTLTAPRDTKHEPRTTIGRETQRMTRHWAISISSRGGEYPIGWGQLSAVQTNVYPSAQRRKLREFDGYRRVAVVIVTDDETYRERQKKREEADGKEVPDGAIVDMKGSYHETPNLPTTATTARCPDTRNRRHSPLPPLITLLMTCS